MVEELAKRLKFLDPKTLHIYVSLSLTLATNESTDWASKFKELSEVLKNTLLIAAGCSVVFGNTLIHSKESVNPQKPREISITQLDRETQLGVLPKILEAEKAEDFLKIIESLHGKQRPLARQARHSSARKRRKK